MSDTSQPIESLILKQLHHELTTDEQHQLEQWLGASPANREEYAALARIWEDSSDVLNARSFDTDAAWTRITQNRKIAAIPTHNTHRSIGGLFKWIAAASLLFLAAGSWYFAARLHPRDKTIVAGNANRIITLPDSSIIYLRKGSSLTYPDAPLNGRGERIATLRGEAFFEIRHDDAQPFSVITAQATIEELGTSFAIRQQDTTCQVMVTDGTVKCSSRTSPAAIIILKAGEQARLVAGNWVRYRQADPNALSWKSHTLEFNQAPLDSVLAAVRDLYGVPVVSSPDLRERSPNIRVTARFTADQRIRDVLDEIRLTTGLAIKQKQDTLIFFPK